MLIKRKLKVGRKRQTFTAYQEWHEVGGRRIFCRSRWEYKFACHLEALKMRREIYDWLHEPETFWFLDIKRGVRSYLPDFKVIRPDGTHYWVEVKGYLDAKSKTKLKRFAKYYPNEQLMLVTESWFKKNGGLNGKESKNI